MTALAEETAIGLKARIRPYPRLCEFDPSPPIYAVQPSRTRKIHSLRPSRRERPVAKARLVACVVTMDQSKAPN